MTSSFTRSPTFDVAIDPHCLTNVAALMATFSSQMKDLLSPESKLKLFKGYASGVSHEFKSER